MLITHDLPIVAQTCQTAAVMYAGRVAELGPTVALHDAPQHPYTRMLFAATPDLAGTTGVASIPGAPPRLDVPLVACPFAPRCDSAFATVPRAAAAAACRSGAATRRPVTSAGLGGMSSAHRSCRCATSWCTTRCRAGSRARSRAARSASCAPSTASR